MKKSLLYEEPQLQPTSLAAIVALHTIKLFFGAVVGSLFGNHHIVRMALAQARAGHARKCRVLLHLLDVSPPRVSHTLAQTTPHLITPRPPQPLLPPPPSPPS